jgi:hypothetical protein
VLINTGTGTLAPPLAFAGIHPYVSVVLGNFIAGGGLDALLVRHDTAGGPFGEAVFELYSNPGSGAFGTSFVFSATQPAVGGVVPYSGAAGLLNADGLTDAVFSSNDNLLLPAGDDVQPPLTATLLESGSGGSFTLTTIPTAYVGRGVEPVIQNLTNDSLPDIVLIFYTNQNAGAGASGTGLQSFVAALVNDPTNVGAFKDPAPNQFGAGNQPGSGDTGNVDDLAGIGPGDAPVAAAMDIVLPNTLGNSVTTLLGNGAGGVASTVVTPGIDAAPGGGTWSGGPRDARLADLDGDGHLDVAVYGEWTGVGATQGHVILARGNGTGAFLPTSFTTLDAAGEFALGDMTLDGKLDVIVTRRKQTPSSELDVYAGDGLGGLSAQPVARVSPTSPSVLSGGLAIADVDGDGRPDAVTTIANGPNGLVFACLGKPGGPSGLTLQPVISPAGAPWVDVTSLLLADVDGSGDGLRDALVGVTSGQLVIVRGALGGTFTPIQVSNYAAAAVAGGGAMALGDLNGDPLTDLVCATGASTNQALVNELLGAAGGSFAVQHVDGLSATSGGGATRPLLADLNGDEATDMVLVHGEANSMTVLLNELASYSTFPAGKPGKGGAQPTLTAKGYAVLGGPFKLIVQHGTGAAHCALYLHYNPTGATPAGGGVFAFNYTGLKPFYFSLAGQGGTAGVGSFTLPTTIPPDPRFAGIAFDAQVLILDPAAGPPAPNKFAATNGLTVRIQ